MNKLTALRDVSNGAERIIDTSKPFIATVAIEGSADILFHRWNVEAVEAKATSAKNSKAKKSDDLESYVYRNAKKEICVPGEYLRMAIVGAAKFKQDPRSPRKSAMDLYKAAIVALTPLASIGKSDWDYLDRRRVQIQRNGVTRARPAMLAGWRVEFDFMVNLPEYVSPLDLNETIAAAGRLIGIGDFRPTFGRFVVTSFKTRQ